VALIAGELNARTWQERQANSTDDRLQAIKTAWDYYEGRHPKPLNVKPGQVDDNTIVNLARPVVDKGIALLFGKPLEMQVDEDASSDNDVEVFLDGVWAANDGPVLLQEVAQNGALAGLAAVKVVPRVGDKQRPYRLINLDPSNLQIKCEDEDIDEVRRYRIQYTCADEQGEELVKRQDWTPTRDANGVALSWTGQDYTAKGADKDFTPAGPPIPWAYALPPIVHCKNLPCANSVWGYGDLEDVRLNDALNLIASTTRKILRLHAHPITIAKNIQGGLLSRDAGAFWEIPNPDGDIKNLEMQSDLASSRDFYMQLRTAFYAMGRMPDVSQIGNLGALTNFGLRVLFADALERTATKRNTYGGLIVRLNKLLCLLDGKGDNVQTTLTWADPLPTNAVEQAQEVTQKQSTGLVSDETLTVELGYDYADEQKRLSVERTKRKAAAPGQGTTGPRVAPADTVIPPGDITGDTSKAAQLAQQAQQSEGQQ
jgi:Phage portal protein, SPP1 Gp6-like